VHELPLLEKSYLLKKGYDLVDHNRLFSKRKEFILAAFMLCFLLWFVGVMVILTTVPGSGLNHDSWPLLSWIFGTPVVLSSLAFGLRWLYDIVMRGYVDWQRVRRCRLNRSVA
jgi:hypothetical protein